MCRQNIPTAGKESLDYLQYHIDNGNKAWALAMMGDSYLIGIEGLKQNYDVWW
jgi:hypothetical protein